MTRFEGTALATSSCHAIAVEAERTARKDLPRDPLVPARDANLVIAWSPVREKSPVTKLTSGRSKIVVRGSNYSEAHRH